MQLVHTQYPKKDEVSAVSEQQQDYLLHVQHVQEHFSQYLLELQVELVVRITNAVTNIIYWIIIPILLITPYIMAKKLQNSDGSCKIKSKD